MIKRIFIDNYKSLVNFELPLQELTLLLGPNGAGKTSVLDVIFALRRLLSGEGKITDKDTFSTQTLTRWQSRRIQLIEIDVHLRDDEMRYRLEVEHDPTSRRARIALESLESNGHPLFRFESGEVQLFRDNHSPGPTFGSDWNESALARVPARLDNKKLTPFLDFMRKIVVQRTLRQNLQVKILS